MLGSRRVVALAERYGADVLEAAFDAMIENCAATIRRELLPRIEDGVYAWEDYVENDGVDAPRLHAMRVTMTKTAREDLLDFTGTSREAKGPINWAIDYSDGKFVRKWMGPVLRSLASSPERAAEIDMNEGVLDVIDVKFPEKGRWSRPISARRPGCGSSSCCARSASSPRCSRRRPAGGCRRITRRSASGGCMAAPRTGDFFLFREVLGGGGPGRPWADGSDVVHIVPNSRNLPAEFSETRYPVLVEKLGLARDSGGAGFRRGGFGYDKRIRALQSCRLLSNADRALVNTYGVNGGRPGSTYRIAVEGRARRGARDRRHGGQHRGAGGLDRPHPDHRRRRLGRTPCCASPNASPMTSNAGWSRFARRKRSTA